ncbi:hypothetical protein SAMN05216567_109199 [Variovorax sp. OK605]|nr:hypothetical protein SAMN05216567_109199 [Variovorax sp. OK605]
MCRYCAAEVNPPVFADYGVADAEAQAMVARAMDGARGRNFIGALAA